MHTSAIVAAAAVLTVTVLAAAAEALPSRDAVIGAGAVTFADWPAGTSTTEQLVVSAHAGFQGEDARGTLILESPLGDQRAEVTCLVVQGSTAIVGGTIVSGTYYPGETVYPRVAVRIQDGGPGGASDGWTGLIFSTPWPDPCARLAQFPGLATIPLEWGAFKVIDAG